MQESEANSSLRCVRPVIRSPEAANEMLFAKVWGNTIGNNPLRNQGKLINDPEHFDLAIIQEIRDDHLVEMLDVARHLQLKA